MDKVLANFLSHTLLHGGYETKTATGPLAIRRVLSTWRPDLALLDLDVHGDAIDLLGASKIDRIPLLVFTRSRNTGVKVDAFRQGADDLVGIPFVLGEILARSYALIRRVHRVTVPFVPTMRFESLEIDLGKQLIRVNGGPELSLTPMEQTLLYLLAGNAGEVVTRDDIVSAIWDGTVEIESNAVDRHVRDLRVKLGDDWRNPKFIETVRGGYRFKTQKAHQSFGAAEAAAGTD